MINPLQANRLWNLRQLVRAAGGINAAAEVLQRHNSYITSIAGPNPSRNIGDKMAQTIETAFGLPPGSLDKEPPAQSRGDDPYLSAIAATLANVADADKEFVLAFSEWIAGRSAGKASLGTVSLGAACEATTYDLSRIAQVKNKSQDACLLVNKRQGGKDANGEKNSAKSKR
ncbi:MAG: hypothetical protein WC023_01650 [Rhodocyclaceae bacterium]